MTVAGHTQLLLDYEKKQSVDTHKRAPKELLIESQWKALSLTRWIRDVCDSLQRDFTSERLIALKKRTLQLQVIAVLLKDGCSVNFFTSSDVFFSSCTVLGLFESLLKQT
jgi:hypothetical protein